MDGETVAAKVIRLIGGADGPTEGRKRIAQACNLTTDAVHKWPVRGRGLVPALYQRPILNLAKRMGVPLTEADVVQP